MPKDKKDKDHDENEKKETVDEPVKKVDTVAELDGVGEVTAAKLEEAGYNTIEMLAVSITENLKALDIDEARAKKIISAARKQIGKFGLDFKTADVVMKEHAARWRLSTHVPSLDEVLGGGFESTTVNTIHGMPGNGKSQTAHWATSCMLVQDNTANVLFVDTENSFRPERILDFLKTLGGTEEDLHRVIHIEAKNSEYQQLILQRAGKEIKDNNVKLLVIDSATAHFRSEFIHRDMLSPRQQTLNAHLQIVSKVTRMFDLVTLLTNQEIGVPVSSYGGGPSSKPVGGFVFGHRGFMNLGVWRPDNPTSEVRIFTIEKHPSLPPRRVEVSLTEQGFFEAKKK